MKKVNIKRTILQTISLPIIWGVIIPMIIFDFCVEIYHRTCFVLYGLKYVKRSKYLKIDRYELRYLNFAEKLGCVYCGYANGLSAYWIVIFGETEKYWCGITHKKYANFKAPEHQKDFVKYNDEEEFTNRYKK